MSYFFAYYGWRIHESNGDNVPWRLALFIIFATFNTLYTSTWGEFPFALSHLDARTDPLLLTAQTCPSRSLPARLSPSIPRS